MVNSIVEVGIFLTYAYKPFLKIQWLLKETDYFPSKYQNIWANLQESRHD